MGQQMVVREKVGKGRGFWKSALPVLVGVGMAMVADVAMAASGGPFGDISSFIQNNFMPFIGSVGVAGGIGYGAVHAFKHDYGKAAMGVGTAAGGGFLISQDAWFGQQAGVTAATMGAHVSTLALIAHGLGL